MEALTWVTLVGVVVSALVALVIIRQYRELCRLRAMKDFLWLWADNGQLQPLVDKALSRKAESVKWYSERLIRLQQDGLRAEENPRCDATDEEGLMKIFDYAKSRLLNSFRRAQSDFYRLYDQIQLFYLMAHVKLKDRSWKVYIGEQSEPQAIHVGHAIRPQSQIDDFDWHE